MTPKEFAELMQALVEESRSDISKGKAASRGMGFAFMASLLRDLGYQDGIDIFESTFGLGAKELKQ